MAEEKTKTVNLTDYEFNLIRGLLVDEEIEMDQLEEELRNRPGDWSNTQNYIKQVRKLRRWFTEEDDTWDYCGAFERIEDYNLI